MNSDQLISFLITKNSGRQGSYSHIATVFPTISDCERSSSCDFDKVARSREKCFEGCQQ